MSDETTSMDEDPPFLREGDLVAGRYRVLEQIGDGSTGIIYRVHDERLRIYVALKLLRPGRASDARNLKRFEQELVLGRQVSHPNVVRIHDIWQDGELHFLTMDLVEGKSLRQVLRERGSLPPEEAIRIARDLASALAAAHAKSVVHRDLKPANVLIDASGRASITDFGIARSFGPAPLAENGMVLGTLAYLSPEQARGEEVDGRTDIYSLGIILYEMLAGKSPFPGTTPEKMILARAFGTHPSLSRAGVVVPGWLQRVVSRCLAADPEERYADAIELENALVAGEPPARRRSTGMITAGLAAALAIAGFGWWYLDPLSEVDRASAADGVLTSVAVLPFDDQSRNDSRNWLASGLTEMLTQGLAEGTNLQVADSLRVIQIVENLHLDPAGLGPKELRRLADLLDVDRLAVGSVSETAGKLRVDLRLIDADAPGRPLTLLRADGNLPELFALADRLSRDLRLALTGDAIAYPTAPMSMDDAAMQAFGDGLHELSRGDAVAASSALVQAVTRDPAFAAAWVRLAESQERLGRDEQALSAARQAARLLVDHPGRLLLEANARVAALSGDFDRAESELSTLVARYPRDVEARVLLAEAYGKHGELERAERELRSVTTASPDHPRAWYLLGKYAILAGDYRSAADDYLVRALVIQNGLRNQAGSADAENALGIAQFSLGNPEAARRRYESAIELRRRIGDERGVAATTANLARIDLDEGRFEPARSGLQDALQIVERVGDRRTVANLHNEIGALEEQQGHFGPALERYRLSLKLFRELGDQRAIAESYNSVGFMHYQLGEFENAAVYAAQALQLNDSTGNREGRMFTDQTLGQLAVARGSWSEAEKSFLEMLVLSREFENPLAEAIANAQLARTAFYQGRFSAAQKSVASGFRALAPDGDARGTAELALIEAEIALELGMLEDGERALAQAGKLLDASGSREQRSEWLRLSAERQLLAGDFRGARRLFDQSLMQASESGVAITRLAAGIGAAEARLESGDAPGAAAAIRPLYDEARAIGHLPLELQSAEILARAESLAGRLGPAEEQLRVTLSKAEKHEPWVRSYRLHWQLADVLRRSGDAGEAAKHGQEAKVELVRLRQGLGDNMRKSFDGLAVVMRIEEPEKQLKTAMIGVDRMALAIK